MASFATSIISFLLLLQIVTSPMHASMDQVCHIRAEEKMTHLHFYFHEVYSGRDATAAMVVAPLSNHSNFGALGVVEDLLREGPEPESRLIGRCKGFVVAAAKEEVSLLTLVYLEFTDGMYNGSSLAVFGKAVLGTVMERPVVGGSGHFRMARGYTLCKQVDSAPGTLVLEYDVYVWH